MPDAQPPVARRVPTERTHHGDTVVDEYEWLRDKESPQTLTYLEAENAYTQARTVHLNDLRERIFDEIRSRTKETDLSVPYRLGDWWYYSRTHEEKQYGASCRCPAKGGRRRSRRGGADRRGRPRARA
jgi:oligopeptidase B